MCAGRNSVQDAPSCSRKSPPPGPSEQVYLKESVGETSKCIHLSLAYFAGIKEYPNIRGRSHVLVIFTRIFTVIPISHNKTHTCLLQALHSIPQVTGYHKRVAAFSRMVQSILVHTHSFGKSVTLNRPAELN
jgi:hypothetical protein